MKTLVPANFISSDVPEVSNDDRASRDEVTLVLVVITSVCSRQTQRQYGTPTVQFFYERVYIGEGLAVAQGREAVGTNHCVKFGMRLVLDLWV